MLALFKKSFFGPVTNEKNYGLKDLNSKELTVLIPLVLLVVWLGVYPKPVLGPIDNSVKALLVQMEDHAQSESTKEAIIVSKKEVK